MITQKGFVLVIMERLEMLDCNSVHMPEYGPEFPVKQPEEKLLGALGVKPCQAIVGSALYLAEVTRYDIYYTFNQLTRACSKPAVVSMTTAKHLPRYLKDSPGLSIIYKKAQCRHAWVHQRFFGSKPR